MLDAELAKRLGGAHSLLLPFLLGGATAALLPVATAGELLAQLTIVSLDPAAPITRETLATARTISQQAALAIDNARLYQQQKQFAETMQRSLLPRERPSMAGLEVGAVYESAAQVDVGGDVFDFLELRDGRLAVVLGDVTGHGIDATADMAMAKFVFRSLAREHTEPSAFLAAANEVVVGEIAIGKFITMVYVTVESNGEVLCASAGHPEPRLVGADGAVTGLACGGLALGIDAPQTYDQVSAQLSHGDMVVLYTDGVIESRAGRELFGLERLDEVLSTHATRPAQDARGRRARGLPGLCRRRSAGRLRDRRAAPHVNLFRGELGRPLVIGHRGAAALAPENTLASLAGGDRRTGRRRRVRHLARSPRSGHSLGRAPRGRALARRRRSSFSAATTSCCTSM